jgi:serine phosphatase RsbU (regulator of sigma subunit)
MTHLDALFTDSDMLGARQTPHLVTLVYLVADGDRITLANAGHPPPLLVPADEPAQFLPVATTVPLGVQPEGRTATEHVLNEGATLLLYTDGLIERRREDIDVGLDRLRACADHLVHSHLGIGVSEVVRAMYDGGRDDDVTALGLRRVRARQLTSRQ